MSYELPGDGGYIAADKKRIQTLAVPFLLRTFADGFVQTSIILCANLKAWRALSANLPQEWVLLSYIGMYPYGNIYVVHCSFCLLLTLFFNNILPDVSGAHLCILSGFAILCFSIGTAKSIRRNEKLSGLLFGGR